MNLGAGVQSVALLLLSHEPDAKPRFDLAIFAETGEEPTAVYTHLHYLRSLDTPEILVRSAGRLGDDVGGRNSTGQRFASIPTFTKGPDGKVGQGPLPVTKEHKIDVCERAILLELLELGACAIERTESDPAPAPATPDATSAEPVWMLLRLGLLEVSSEWQPGSSLLRLAVHFDCLWSAGRFAQR
jgi:hypothetical protein